MDALCSPAAQEHAAQVRQVRLIAELCGSYATLEASGPALPGHERLVRAGGAGTPRVAEHLATELAPKLRLSLVTACLLVSDSIDLVVRHPRVWDAARAGRARVWQARQVAAATRTAGLSLEAAGWVDERFVRIRQHGDGTALVVARTDAADAHRLDHALSQLAGQLALAGHTHEFDVLRAGALGVLARPEHATALLAGPDAPGVEPGQTCPDNLGPLSRRVHNAKTHAGWRVEQPRPGCSCGPHPWATATASTPTAATNSPGSTSATAPSGWTSSGRAPPDPGRPRLSASTLPAPPRGSARPPAGGRPG